MRILSRGVATACLCALSLALGAQWDTTLYRLRAWPDGAILRCTAPTQAN